MSRTVPGETPASKRLAEGARKRVAAREQAFGKGDYIQNGTRLFYVLEPIKGEPGDWRVEDVKTTKTHRATAHELRLFVKVEREASDG